MMGDFLISAAYAADAKTAAPGGALSQILMLALFGVIFYFILWRPQRKRTKEQQQMLGNLRKGDEVVTNGGLLGKISDMQEDILVLNIADNVNVRLQKHAVVSILPKGTLKTAC